MPRCIGTPVRDAARSRRPEYSAHHSIASLSKHADVESLSRHYIAMFFDVEDIVFTDGGKVPFDCSGEITMRGYSRWSTVDLRENPRYSRQTP
jgi:hypothetical protein